MNILHQTQTRSTYLWLGGVLVLFCVGTFLYSASSQVLEYIASSDATFFVYVQEHLLSSLLIFALFYIVVAAVALPFESALSIIAGYYFGTLVGVATVSVSATIGSLIAFLLIKYYIHDWFHRTVTHTRIQQIIKALNTDPLTYLLFLRWTPLFPHLIINVALSFSSVKTRIFIIGTFLGVVPSTIVFVLAGTQLATIRETGKVLTPGTLAILFLMALFSLVPLIAKKYVKKNPSMVEDVVASLVDDAQ